MIGFYKRKIEWIIDKKETTIIYDSIEDGTFNKFTIKPIDIQPSELRDQLKVAKKFNLYYLNCQKIIEEIKKVAKNFFSFMLVFDFYYLNNGTAFCNINYNVAIRFNDIPVDFISIDNSADFIIKFNAISDKILNIKKLNFVEYNKDLGLPIIFCDSAACVLSHEVFGHIFEVDNYYKYEYESVLELVKEINVDITDDPSIPKSNGFYSIDDMGLKATKTHIIKNGIFTSLIGSLSKEKIVSTSLRRDSFKNCCYPRMSNLIISPRKIKRISFSNYIKINKLNNCFLRHKDGVVEFNIDLSYQIYENKMCIIKPYKLEFKLIDLLKNMSAITYCNKRMQPIQCLKHGQIVNCGARSPNWIINMMH